MIYGGCVEEGIIITRLSLFRIFRFSSCSSSVFSVCSLRCMFGFFFLSSVRSFVRSLCHCCQISNACSICLIPFDEFAEIINLCWVQCTLIWKHLSNSFKLKYIMERNHWRNFIRSWIMTNWLANNRSHFGKIVLEFLNGRTDNMRRR